MNIFLKILTHFNPKDARVACITLLDILELLQSFYPDCFICGWRNLDTFRNFRKTFVDCFKLSHIGVATEKISLSNRYGEREEHRVSGLGANLNHKFLAIPRVNSPKKLYQGRKFIKLHHDFFTHKNIFRKHYPALY